MRRQEGELAELNGRLSQAQVGGRVCVGSVGCWGGVGLVRSGQLHCFCRVLHCSRSVLIALLAITLYPLSAALRRTLWQGVMLRSSGSRRSLPRARTWMPWRSGTATMPTRRSSCNSTSRCLLVVLQLRVDAAEERGSRARTHAAGCMCTEPRQTLHVGFVYL